MRNILELAAVMLLGAMPVFAAGPKLDFTGNKAFTSRQLNQALAGSIDYDFVAHPLAPKEKFAANLEHLLRVAYADRGFASAKVKVSADANGRWRVSINEGPKFKCGKVTVKAKDAALARKLEAFLSEPIGEQLSGADGRFDMLLEADWANGSVAKVTRARLESLGWNARWFCLENKYFETKAVLRPQVLENGVVDLVVEMDLGGQQENAVYRLGEVKVHGCKVNLPGEVIEFLQLKRGMVMDRLLHRRLERALAQSGRFLTQEVHWGKPDAKGVAGLEIHVTECPFVPPLRERLSGTAKTALGIHREFMNLQPGREWRIDLTVDASGAKPDVRKLWVNALGAAHTHSRLVLSADGIGGAVQSVEANAKKTLLMGAMMLKGKPVGVMLPGRKVKWMADSVALNGGAFANVTIAPSQREDGKSMFKVDGGYSTAANKAFDLNLDLSAAMVLYELHKPDSEVREFFTEQLKLDSVKTTAEKGITISRLTAILRQSNQPIALEYHADAKSRPLSLKVHGVLNGVKLQLVAAQKENAATEFAQTLAAETKSLPNRYKPGHGFSTGIAFGVSQVVPAINQWATKVLEGNFEAGGIAENLKHKAQQKLLEILGPRFGQVLEPLDELFVGAGAFQIRSGSFQDVPAPEVVRVNAKTVLLPIGNSVKSFVSDANPASSFRMRNPRREVSMLHGMLMMLGAFRHSLFTEDSWPAIVLRESELAGLGSTHYTETALLRIATHGKGGPLACLLGAQVLNSIDSPDGVRLARIGLQRLNEKGLEADLRPFLDAKSPVIRAVDRLLAQSNPAVQNQLFGGIPGQYLNPKQKEALTKKIAGKNLTATDLIEPILKNLVMQMGPAIAAELQIAQFGSLRHIRAQAEQGRAQHQFVLGLMHFQGRGLNKDLVEAFAWASRASAQGHPDAGRLRAAIIGQMTDDQFNEGMKRARQKD